MSVPKQYNGIWRHSECKRCKTDYSRNQWRMLKTEYKKNVKRKRRQFEIKHVSNTKEFWKYFKTKDKQTDNGIDLDSFLSIFQKSVILFLQVKFQKPIPL